MTRSIQIFAFLLLVLTSSVSTGQSYIGVFGGLNSSKLTGDSPNKAKYKSLMGANVGAYIDIKLGKIVWLSIQPSYTQEGTKISYSVKGLEEPVDSISIRLNYFSLPIFLKVSSTNERFYALAYSLIIQYRAMAASKTLMRILPTGILLRILGQGSGSLLASPGYLWNCGIRRAW